MNIGELEELILLAVRHLGGESYGAPICDALEETGRDIAIGSIYITLARLEKKGYIEGRQTEQPSERGGKPKRHFKLTGKGALALDEAEQRRAKLKSLMPLLPRTV